MFEGISFSQVAVLFVSLNIEMISSRSVSMSALRYPADFIQRYLDPSSN